MITDRSTSGDDSPGWDPVARHVVFTAKTLRDGFEDLLKRSGASLGTWVVLSALSREGVVSQTALAGHVHVEGATITHHVDRLEELGLVRRRVDPDDRRVRRIEPTEAGKRLHERLLVEARAFEEAVLAGLDAQEQAHLRSLLDRIAANLDAWREAQPS